MAGHTTDLVWFYPVAHSFLFSFWEQQGHDVHILVDGVASQNSTDCQVALDRMSRAGAFLTTAQSAAFMLLQTSDHPSFETVTKLTMEYTKPPPHNRFFILCAIIYVIAMAIALVFIYIALFRGIGLEYWW
mmetsp:Transcript_7331/g.16664  ORF Transcript_7331/g.16664 Transcript_7331/m.16664 type:complete len:131 (-) Transcript_7331:1170-1562(-)